MIPKKKTKKKSDTVFCFKHKWGIWSSPKKHYFYDFDVQRKTCLKRGFTEERRVSI